MVNGGELTVLARNEGNSIEIQIADTREEGSPAESFRDLYDPSCLRKQVGKTSSLDLSICHNIIQHHKGEFQIINNQGQGTTFLLRLAASLP